MHEMIRNFLVTFADSLRMARKSDGAVLFGILKLYDDSEKPAPRKTNCVGLSRLVRHLASEFERIQTQYNLNLSFSEADLRYAVQTIGCRKGTGGRPHVVMLTPRGEKNLKFLLDTQRDANEAIQDAFFAKFDERSTDGGLVGMPQLEITESMMELITQANVN